MKADPSVLDFLERAVDAEAQAALQYDLDWRALSNLGLKKLGHKLKARAAEERQHLKIFTDRMIFFGVYPQITPDSAVSGASVTELIVRQAMLETEAATLYQGAITACVEADDEATGNIFLEILADENEHLAYLQNQQAAIKAAGEQGYITAQLAR